MTTGKDIFAVGGDVLPFFEFELENYHIWNL